LAVVAKAAYEQALSRAEESTGDYPATDVDGDSELKKHE
jgi:hypothetical protein